MIPKLPNPFPKPARCTRAHLRQVAAPKSHEALLNSQDLGVNAPKSARRFPKASRPGCSSFFPTQTRRFYKPSTCTRAHTSRVPAPRSQEALLHMQGKACVSMSPFPKSARSFPKATRIRAISIGRMGHREHPSTNVSHLHAPAGPATPCPSKRIASRSNVTVYYWFTSPSLGWIGLLSVSMD